MRATLGVNRFAAPIVSLVSLILLALLFMPPRDEMLQFVDESGLINVYLLTLTFLISPVTETDLIRYEAEKEAMKHQGEFYKQQLKVITEYGARHSSPENTGRSPPQRSRTMLEDLSSRQKSFLEERKNNKANVLTKIRAQKLGRSSQRDDEEEKSP